MLQTGLTGGTADVGEASFEMKFAFWFSACMTMLLLVLTNLMLGTSALETFGLANYLMGTSLAVVSALLWLAFFLLIPLFLAWKLGKLKFLGKVNKKVLVFFTLLCFNLPFVPCLYWLHPRPVTLSLNASSWSDVVFGADSRVSRFMNWVFANDVQSGRIYLGKNGQVLCGNRFESRTGNFNPEGRALLEIDDKLGYFERDGSVTV